MENGLHTFLKNCLLLDIEVNEHGVVYSLGAVYGEQVFRAQGTADGRIDRGTIEELADFGRGARYLLGHNILDHDIPCLQKLAPRHPLLSLPGIDTLFLSPLAYPENPYHRLVKDYKLVRDSINDPVRDARLAGQVFAEQWERFRARFTAGDESVVLSGSLLRASRLYNTTGRVFETLGMPLLTGEELYHSFDRYVTERGCRTGAARLVDTLSNRRHDPAIFAYLVAWLSVAGGNSILPPWVRHRFPEIGSLLRTVREIDCGEPACEYCQNHFRPLLFLRKFYGFQEFRAEPQTEDGGSLQQAIVEAAAGDQTLFGVLPTGGGKSLCYLLPAIMRYVRRNLLTIVISPLQALMKDQVDNFSRQTGTRMAAALYGMLTMVERAEVMEAIRLGDLGILFVSPEQLRNRSFLEIIRQREIGAWVFDEAHCLSKWGHDFRPDYLYAIRFIRERAEEARSVIPPVQCFTATAKQDVRREIMDLIQANLGHRVEYFSGGHERSNLNYQVLSAESREKNSTILGILKDRWQPGTGSVVIYCATRHNTEKLADFLVDQGYEAEPFHAGLEIPLKKRLQDQFVSGELPIICATNAFGMGIDKEDVRLVIHADIPGSLENYLQEAGRAGRDLQQAECVLVFDEQDIEKQFQLSSFSQLAQKDISQILRSIRWAARGTGKVVMTPGDILRQEVADFDEAEMVDPETRVRTAVAWLERAGFLERNENNTRVFQGRPLVKNLAEAKARIQKLDLSKRQERRWLAIIRELMQRRPDEGFSADELAGHRAFARTGNESPDETESQRVLKTLQAMSEQGLLAKETTLSAWIRYKVAGSSDKQLEALCVLEQEFVRLLSQEAWDADTEQTLELDLRQVNQRLLDAGQADSNQEVLRNLLYTLARDGRGLAGRKGSLQLRPIGPNRLRIRLLRNWEDLATTMRTRQQVARVALEAIIREIPGSQKPGKDVMVSFTLEKVVAALKSDLVLVSMLKNPLAAAERGLTYMHEQGIIDLQQGLAVFRQAMTIHLHPEASSRRYLKKDFEPLATHYNEKIFQIHVMNEYARQAVLKISSAMRLVAAYFHDDRERFIERFFPGKKQKLSRATSEQSYDKLVTSLGNRVQEQIVGAPISRNILVLAGPGAGKSRVVIHRVAYLLRVERVRPSGILVLCFNRAAVAELRSRLRELVGDEMARVTTCTFHGLALRLTGRSLLGSERGKGQVDFSGLIREANKLLAGGGGGLGFTEGMERDQLVGRFSHLLVDEYQDIDADQYEMISLLVGKSLEEQDRRMSILAVGDDDQNIYRFRGANIEFIRRFQEDYQAEIYHLTENFRSTHHIVEAANAVIRRNRDRMKHDVPIRVNQARSMLPPGGRFGSLDVETGGRVQVIKVATKIDQAGAVLAELTRLQGVTGDELWNRCCILARNWKDLAPVRAVLEKAEIPVDVNWGSQSGFPRLSRIRENVELLSFLREHRQESFLVAELLDMLVTRCQPETVWTANLKRLLREFETDVGAGTRIRGFRVEEYLYEGLREQGRGRCLGRGVFLSTVHSVKGLEFDHVMVLGEGWGRQDGGEQEEERRLFYVAMTRARHSLCLFRIDGREHQFCEGLNGSFILQKQWSGDGNMELPEWDRIGLLGMEDLFLDFAGVRRKDHPERCAVEKLSVGDRLRFFPQGTHVVLKNMEAIPVGRLSKKGYARWHPVLDRVHSLEVIGVVCRYPEDVADPGFRENCHGSMWELPLVEVRYRS